MGIPIDTTVEKLGLDFATRLYLRDKTGCDFNIDLNQNEDGYTVANIEFVRAIEDDVDIHELPEMVHKLLSDDDLYDKVMQNFLDYISR